MNYQLLIGLIGRCYSKIFYTIIFNKTIKIYICKGLLEYTIGDGIILHSLSFFIMDNYII
jgi:hypothetical protein